MSFIFGSTSKNTDEQGRSRTDKDIYDTVLESPCQSVLMSVFVSVAA